MIEFQDERTDGEAGVQVPLLPVSGTSQPAGPHVRVRPVGVEPGARGAVEGVDAGAEAGHVRRHVPDAHRMEAGARDSVAVRGVECRAPARAPAPPERLRQLLGEAGEVPELLRLIVTADTADHAKVRLRALAALEGYADLPRGEELERLAGLAQLSNATAYSARKIPPPAPRAKPGRS